MRLVKSYFFVKFLKTTTATYLVFLSCLLCPALSRASYLLTSSHITLGEISRSILADLVITALDIMPIISIVSVVLLLIQLVHTGELGLVRVLGVGAFRISGYFLAFNLVVYLLAQYMSLDVRPSMMYERESSMEKIKSNVAISALEEGRVLKAKNVTLYINDIDLENHELRGLFILYNLAISKGSLAALGYGGNNLESNFEEALLFAENGSIIVSDRTMEAVLENVNLDISGSNASTDYSLRDANFGSYISTIPFSKKVKPVTTYSNMNLDDLFYNFFSVRDERRRWTEQYGSLEKALDDLERSNKKSSSGKSSSDEATGGVKSENAKSGSIKSGERVGGENIRLGRKGASGLNSGGGDGVRLGRDEDACKVDNNSLQCRLVEKQALWKSYARMMNELIRRFIYPLYTLIGGFGAAVAMTSFPVNERSIEFKKNIPIISILFTIIVGAVFSKNVFSTMLLNYVVLATVVLIIAMLFLVAIVRNHSFE